MTTSGIAQILREVLCSQIKTLSLSRRRKRSKEGRRAKLYAVGCSALLCYVLAAWRLYALVNRQQ
jgi:hypothetical protein